MFFAVRCVRDGIKVDFFVFNPFLLELLVDTGGVRRIWEELVEKLLYGHRPEDVWFNFTRKPFPSSLGALGWVGDDAEISVWRPRGEGRGESDVGTLMDVIVVVGR